MLKKFVSSLMVICMLAGCGGSEKNTAAAEKGTQDAATIAADIVEDLNLKDSMEEVKSRVVKGMFFQGEDVTENACVYFSSTSGNSDTVGVFISEDTASILDYLHDYLEEQKAQTQTYYPEEVFKISNAIVDENGSMVILVICNNIEEAKTKVTEVLGK